MMPGIHRLMVTNITYIMTVFNGVISPITSQFFQAPEINKHNKHITNNHTNGDTKWTI